MSRAQNISTTQIMKIGYAKERYFQATQKKNAIQNLYFTGIESGVFFFV